MERRCVMIKVRRRKGIDGAQDVMVYGWPTGLLGLYVTLDYSAALDGFKRYGYTHIKSGIGFHSGDLGCKRVAIRYAKKHFSSLDWTLDEKHVAKQPGAVAAYEKSKHELEFK